MESAEGPCITKLENMRSNRFTLAVIVQAVLLAVNGAASVVLLGSDYLWITKIFFLIIWILQILILIWYVNRTNRELENFLLSLKYLDKILLSGSGKSFKRLNLTYNQIVDILREERAVRESEYQYFRETVEHITTGLISMNSDGRINLINGAAKNILQCGSCSSLDELGKISGDLPDIINSLEPSRPQLISLKIDNQIVKVSLNLALLKIQDEFVRIVSLTDIRGELEEGELDAWEKLIRILTHEIVNSVTPINTLTTAMMDQLEKAGYPDNKHTRNLTLGFQAIRKRNLGLLAFVENFQRINKVPVPDFQMINVEALFANLQSIVKEEFKNTELAFIVVDGFNFEADEELLIQVLINLLKNSVEAEAKKVEFISKLSEAGRPRIIVKDNGHGIEEEYQDKIFIPFFTSKKQGSGIGLSLSRQILRLHRGDILVSSSDSMGSSIVLNF